MNSLWPAASRISCIQPRTIFRTCRKIDSLAAGLSNRVARPYSISLLPFSWGEANNWERQWRVRLYNAPRSASRFCIGIRSFASERAGIITEFEKLPRNYKDEKGLKFREEIFTPKETASVFGKGIDANSANRLLRVLHGRRVAGTLEDPDAPSILSVYESQAKKVALSWLREHVPVDETRNYGLRAEKELREMEEKIIDDSQKIGLYKPNSQKIGPGQSVYGNSGLDAIRKQRQMEEDAREAAEAKRKTQADEVRHNTGTLEPMSASKRVELSAPGENKLLKYYLERSKVLPNTPPDMTWFQRLWPSTLLVFGVVGLCFIFPTIYTPPKNSQRMFPDIPPAAATVLGLILANGLVFMMWRFPPAFRMLNKYFITVPGYPWALSLVGNIFSHQSFYHLSINMLVLYFVGSRLHDEVGRANFLSIYIASGTLASFTSLTSYVLRNVFITSSLGASGALAGVIAAYLWLNRNEPIGFFGYFLPKETGWSIPSWVPLSVFIGIDIYALTKKRTTPVTMDHWAHLGGYGAGIVAASILDYRQEQKKKTEMERRKNLAIMDRIREGRL
jgi:rhomboid-like protein